MYRKASLRTAPLAVAAALAVLALSPAVQAAPKAPQPPNAPKAPPGFTAASLATPPKPGSKNPRRMRSPRPVARASALDYPSTFTGTCSFYYEAGLSLTARLNSNFAHGDTYVVAYRKLQAGVFSSWNYSTPFTVRQSPGVTDWVAPGLRIPRNTWVALQVAVYSYKARAYIYNQAPSGALVPMDSRGLFSQVDAAGYSCKTY